MTHADTLSAGIASGGVWISKTTLTAGDVSQLYTVVYNSDTSAISGTVLFLVDDAPLSTTSVSLASGESHIISVPWTATQGTHTIRAQLTNVSSGTGATNAAHTDTAALSITVAAPPPPSPIIQATQQAASVAQNTASVAIPLITQTVGVIASTTENMRTTGAKALTAALAASNVSTTKAAPAHKGVVLGTSTSNVITANNANAAGNIGHALYTGLLSFVHFIFGNAVVFYPFFAIILFLLFIFLRNKFLRPQAY